MNQLNDKFTAANEAGFNLRALFFDLVEQRWLIIAITSLCLIFSTIYALSRTPQYQANVLIHIMNSQNNLGIMGSVSKIAQSQISTDDPIARQSALIRSRFILEPVINILGLNISIAQPMLPLIGWIFKHDYPVLISELSLPSSYKKQALKLVKDSNNHFRLYNQYGDLLLEGAIGAQVKSRDGRFSIQVDSLLAPIGETFILSKNPHDKIINNLIQRIKIIDLGMTLTGMSQRTGILQVVYSDANAKRVVDVLRAIAKVVQEKDVEKKSLEAQKTLDFLQQQLPSAKSSLADAEKKLHEYRARSGKVDIKMQTQFLLSHVADIDRQLETVRLTKMDMAQKYTNEHPFMISLNQKIKDLQSEQVNLQSQLKKFPAADQVAINLMRDVKVKNDLYLVLLNKIQELTVVKAGTLSDVRILSPPTLPDEAMPRGSLFIIMGSTIFGLFLGCLFVMGRKIFLHRIDDPHWIERNLSINNLVIVPFSATQASHVRANKIHQAAIPLLAKQKPDELAIESLRSLRTSFQLMSMSASNNIMSIVGVSPAVGKSFISANFAYLLAEAGQRVLLIDGDIRKGHLHSYFHTARSQGLSDVIKRSISIDDAIRRNAEHENLCFLPTGELPNNPSEVIMDSEFKLLLATVSKQFDLVIIDTAPILAVTDGVLIASLADINFLVIGSNRHQPGEVELAIKRLSGANIKLHGYVYNNITSESKVYGHAKYHYHYAYK